MMWGWTAIPGQGLSREAAVARRSTGEARKQEIIQAGSSLDGMHKGRMDACRDGEEWVRGCACAPKEALLTLCRLALGPRGAERAAMLGIAQKEVGR